MSDRKPKHDEKQPKSNKEGPAASTAASKPLFRFMKIEQTSEPELVISHRAPGPSGKVIEPIRSDFDEKPSVEHALLVNPHQWNDPQLTVLGLYYPLGPCKTRLMQSELRQVLLKLKQTFREQSLHTSYNDCPISAICKSLDQVEFEVVLFSARDDDEKMILEISRRDGDSVSFHFYAQQILGAVLNMDPELRTVVSPFWNINLLSQADSIGERAENVDEAIKISWNLVCSGRYDACRLGLESVKHMTDPNKSGWSSAKAVAACLIRPNSPVEQELSQKILQFACHDTVAREPEDSVEPTFSGLSLVDFAHLGLVIISQTLQVAAGAQTMDVKTFLDVCPDNFVGSILEKVKNVRSDPHCAYYAVQCLASLCHCVPSTKALINGSDVEQAQLVGNSCHLALATATEKLLVSLQA